MNDRYGALGYIEYTRAHLESEIDAAQKALEEFEDPMVQQVIAWLVECEANDDEPFGFADEILHYWGPGGILDEIEGATTLDSAVHRILDAWKREYPS